MARILPTGLTTETILLGSANPLEATNQKPFQALNRTEKLTKALFVAVAELGDNGHAEFRNRLRGPELARMVVVLSESQGTNVVGVAGLTDRLLAEALLTNSGLSCAVLDDGIKKLGLAITRAFEARDGAALDAAATLMANAILPIGALLLSNALNRGTRRFGSAGGGNERRKYQPPEPFRSVPRQTRPPAPPPPTSRVVPDAAGPSFLAQAPQAKTLQEAGKAGKPFCAKCEALKRRLEAERAGASG
jgi:hypothetical protein